MPSFSFINEVVPVIQELVVRLFLLIALFADRWSKVGGSNGRSRSRFSVSNLLSMLDRAWVPASTRISVDPKRMFVRKAEEIGLSIRKDKM